jgi:exodeoxyribonuclease VII large subunit
VLARRFPLLSVEILPVPVQGDAAAAGIVRTLDHALASGRFDALLLTRGGGSLEDLWAFNDETLVRRLAAATVPVVAAIGHEIDVSLAELAAAMRAPTPSAAAELLVPDQRAVLGQLEHLHHRQAAATRRHLATASQGLDRALLKLQSQAPGRRLERGRERLAQARRNLLSGIRHPLESRRARLLRQQLQLRALHPNARLRDARDRLERARSRCIELAAHGLRARRQQIDSMGRALHAVGPLGTLERGYAILRDPGSGALLRDRHQFEPGQAVSARLHDGEVLLRVLPGQPDGADGSGKG